MLHVNEEELSEDLADNYQKILPGSTMDAWDEVSFLGNILKVTVLGDRDSSARPLRCRVGSLPATATLQRCLLPKARKLQQGWDCFSPSGFA